MLQAALRAGLRARVPASACISSPSPSLFPLSHLVCLDHAFSGSPSQLVWVNHRGCEPREGVKAGIRRKLCLRNPLKPVRENNPAARK